MGDTLPLDLLKELHDLELELQEGDITERGFTKRKNKLLERLKTISVSWRLC